MKCVICKHGETREGATTVTFDRDGMTLVVKAVPALHDKNIGLIRIRQTDQNPDKDAFFQ
ncbi:YgiT-type zinc finger protein [Methanoregula sp.]|jgi:YgiT-type zinc finger domain-containing protein|uniref:YgiT-type zinc finger protein n=1 Tax=Methanoregula sp. TaxID=2052170 RepID=UPI003D0BA8FA